MTVRIVFDSHNLVYKPGETITGKVVVSANGQSGGMQHTGLRVSLRGSLILSSKGRGARSNSVLDSLSKAERTVSILERSKDLLSPGRLIGDTMVDFSLQLIPDGGSGGRGELFETYHGNCVSIEYVVVAEMNRTGLKRGFRTISDVIVHKPVQRPDGGGEGSGASSASGGLDGGDAIALDIRPQTVGWGSGFAGGREVPDFAIKGRIDSSRVDLGRPLTGELWIEKGPPVEVIEVRLIRREVVSTSDMNVKQESEAQACEIVTGDIARNVKVPIYVLLQRFLVCPSTSHTMFDVSFFLSFVVRFADGKTEEAVYNTPIEIFRFYES